MEEKCGGQKPPQKSALMGALPSPPPSPPPSPSPSASPLADPFRLEMFSLVPNYLPESDNYEGWEQMRSLQAQLATKKDLFGTIPHEMRKQTTYLMDVYRELFQPLVVTYHAQLVTHAWLKMYEMLSWSHQNYHCLIPSSTLNKEKVRVFCNAELPGGFIGALNHFIPSVLHREWEWLACSLHSGSKAHIPDSFGLRARYPERWLQNKHMNGDVTKIENLLHIRERVLNKFYLGVALYTSDAGCDVSQNFNAQEELMSLIHLGQVLLGLLITKKGGNMLIKQFTFFHPFTCSLLACVSRLFERITFIKPETSNRRNSEIYVFYENYNLTNEEFAASATYSTMHRLLAECSKKTKLPTDLKDPELWKIDPAILHCLVQAATTFGQLQLEALDMFHFLAKEKHSKKTQIFRVMSKEVSATFLSKYPIHPLDARFWLSRLAPQRSHKKRYSASRYTKIQTHPKKTFRQKHSHPYIK